MGDEDKKDEYSFLFILWDGERFSLFMERLRFPAELRLGIDTSRTRELEMVP